MDHDDQSRGKTFTRRAFVIGAGQGLFLGILGTRLAWLQIAQGKKYKTLAERNRINTKLIAPSRGQIVDRFGVPLAINNRNFRILVIPEQTNDLKSALTRLSEFISLSPDDIDNVLKDAKRTPSFLPIQVADDLNWEDIAKVEVHITDLPGMSTDVGEIRSYPFQNATAHIVGYVGAVNEKDLKDSDALLTLPGFRIGKTGLEKAFDKELRGTKGSSQMEVNVKGREIRELGRDNSLNGARLTLSIDAELQLYTQQRLAKERSASAVIMDSYTGAIYAMVSHPSFDPNLFVRGISHGAWQSLLDNIAHPLTNKAVAGLYPPGSTFKMVTAMAALDAGIINARSQVHCPGYYEYGRDKFHCWKHSGHGTVNLTGALAQSCDTFFYKYSTDLGIDKIAAMARRLGLGQAFDFDLTEEKKGLVPDKAWKRGKLGQKWQPGETIVASIGQGYIQTTPLQLATMTSRLINGGYAVNPWMTAYINQQPRQNEQWDKINLNPYHLKLIKKGMDAVTSSEKGTAHKAQIQEPGMEMGGKSGTAQVKRITQRERALGIKNEDLKWKHHHHALFVGYAPMKKPRYVCSVVVEHGGGGSSVAAPIARDLLTMVQKRNPALSKITPLINES